MSSFFPGTGENTQAYPNHLERLESYRCLSPAPRVPGSVGLEWGQGICISNKPPGDADATGPDPQQKNRCPRVTLNIQYPVSSKDVTQQTQTAERSSTLTGLRRDRPPKAGPGNPPRQQAPQVHSEPSLLMEMVCE